MRLNVLPVFVQKSKLPLPEFLQFPGDPFHLIEIVGHCRLLFANTQRDQSVNNESKIVREFLLPHTLYRL